MASADTGTPTTRRETGHARRTGALVLIVLALAASCSSAPAYEGAPTSTSPPSSPFDGADRAELIEQETILLRGAEKQGLDTTTPTQIEVTGLFSDESSAREFADSIDSVSSNVQVEPTEGERTKWRVSAQRAMALTPENLVDWMIEFGQLVRDAGGEPAEGWEARGEAS